MPKVQALFDERTLELQRLRRDFHDPSTHPLFQEAQARLDERQADVKREFNHSTDWANGEHEPYDLITSCLTVQNANALQGELATIYASLAQGGLFLGVWAGGQTLHELRACLMEAELALTGGASPRLHPLPDLETMSRLLAATGFALPVADQERVTLVYPDMNALLFDLRSHGCANALSERSRRFAPRNLFDKALEIYAARFPAPSGGIAVTVDLIFLHGWRE